MADVVSPEVRSRMMSGIRGKNTKPELILRKGLHAMGVRYRLHVRMPGRPDMVVPSLNAVIFVHGCFWHGHDCARGARAPRTNAAYWSAKIARNRARDEANLKALAAQGWRTIVVYECALRDLHALRARLGAALA